jgi:HAMP domain-containing protein
VTMIVPPAAEPPAPATQRRVRRPAVNGDAAAGPAGGAGAAPSSRLRDAIARDRDDRRGGRPRPEDADDGEADATPTPEVRYRSTRDAGDRPLTLTPPPDAVLERTGVRIEELGLGRDRRRGRFARRLAALVALPVTLSWLLSAWFIYVLLPDELRPQLWVPLAAAAAVAALTGALSATLATSRIANDVARLREDTERIAMGELGESVRVRRSDELGDVAASIDRLRVSLREALERLRKR